MNMFQKASRFVSEYSSDRIWAPGGRDAVRDMLNASVFFDFSSVGADMEHYEFGLELMERGIFRLPFDVVSYADTTSMVIASKRADDIGVCVFLDSPGSVAVPVGLVFFEDTKVKSFEFSATPTSVALLTDDALLHIFPTRDHAQERIRVGLGQVAGLTSVLMSRGCSTSVRRAPSFINRKRLARGEVGIPETHIVTVDAGAMDVSSGDEYINISSYTRGSPRPHWRRGHFRNIQGADGSTRVVPVVPCLVNAVGIDEVSRSAYRVKSPG